MTPENAYAEAEQWHHAYGVVPPELEEVIASDCYYSYWYAKHVIKGRFELGEPSVATNAKYSYFYAKYVINGRFELGESIISTDIKYARNYSNLVDVPLT